MIIRKDMINKMSAALDGFDLNKHYDDGKLLTVGPTITIDPDPFARFVWDEPVTTRPKLWNLLSEDSREFLTAGVIEEEVDNLTDMAEDVLLDSRIKELLRPDAEAYAILCMCERAEEASRMARFTLACLLEKRLEGPIAKAREEEKLHHKGFIDQIISSVNGAVARFGKLSPPGLPDPSMRLRLYTWFPEGHHAQIMTELTMHAQDGDSQPVDAAVARVVVDTCDTRLKEWFAEMARTDGKGCWSPIIDKAYGRLRELADDAARVHGLPPIQISVFHRNPRVGEWEPVFIEGDDDEEGFEGPHEDLTVNYDGPASTPPKAVRDTSVVYVSVATPTPRPRVDLLPLDIFPPTASPGFAPLAVAPPHCDQDVLHAPGVCSYCDMHPNMQQRRVDDGVNFTGQFDTTKAPCPASLARPGALLGRWRGNRPVRLGKESP